MPTDIRALSEVLGLHNSFIQDVEGRGQIAIIDRTRTVDKSGSQGRLLSMVQQFGLMLDEHMSSGKPIPAQDQAELAARIAEAHGVNTQLALRLIGAVMETFEFAAHTLGRRERSELDQMETAERMSNGRGEDAPTAEPLGPPPTQ